MFVPEKKMLNDELSQTLDTSDEWIRTRTGICARHLAAPTDTVADFGTKAASDALAEANVEPGDVDMIVLATTSPDHVMPATATHIQHNLGAKRAFAFDVQAVCSGFVYALAIADKFIKTGSANNVLVIGAEIMSRLLDWSDRSTCVLFGDGAGAVLVQRREQPGILSTRLYSNGEGYYMLYSDDSDARFKRGKIVMNGRAVYSTAIEMMEASVRAELERHGLSVDDVDWFVAHQANKRIIDSVAARLGLPAEKAVVTIESFANTSAATIPISLKLTNIKKGELVVLSSMGAGFTWGTAVLRW
jgi:3-oxoacyl-[acyl-carrier-protein] synthase-3